MNNLKTVLLLGLMSGLLLWGGEALAGDRGLMLGLLMAVVMNAVSYFFSDRIALSMYSAQLLTPETEPQVYARVSPLVGRLCQRLSIPAPKLWLIPEESPNAFATGRDPEHASVAITYGLVSLMSDRELEGVLAHELGHIKHRDILISSIAATLAAALTFLARMSFWFGLGGRRDEESRGGGVFMLIVAPVAAMLIQMAISRTREFAADESAARSTGSPQGLISALHKLEAYSKRLPLAADPSTAHMFIIQPFSGNSLFRFFSTHPSTERRIAALQALR